MKQLLAIAGKDWRTSVDTPVVYVAAAAFMLVSGFVFGSGLFLGGQAELRTFLGWLPLLWMFFLPALAMRSLAEERRLGTFEVLATLPVSSGQVVAGKFVAVMWQVLLLLLLTLAYPLSLAMLSSIDIGQALAAFAGALLLGSSYAALCLFASSLTANAVVAYIVGFSLILGFVLLDKAVMLVSPLVQTWLQALSPVQHYESMLRGVVTPEDVMFFLSFSMVFLLASNYQLERRRWT
ncbi:MAG: ABC transporter permease [Mariprofundaceae bacterium]